MDYSIVDLEKRRMKQDVVEQYFHKEKGLKILHLNLNLLAELVQIEKHRIDHR